jgi:signal transduction histidine kinase/ligand-binding sensor domain-containing protein
MHSLFRFLALVLLACASLAGTPAQGAAAPAPPPIIPMQHTSWTAADGAPSGVVSIKQTPDGWIWLASASGLFRFDGVRFQRAPAALAPMSSNIAELGVLADGTLWVSYTFGGLSMMKDGKAQHFQTTEKDMPGATITGLSRDGEGRLWLSSYGLRLLGADGKWHWPDPAMRAPRGDIESLVLDRDGVLWVRSSFAVYALPKGGTRFERRLKVGGLGMLGAHPDGSVWTSHADGAGLTLVAGRPGADPSAWRDQGGIGRFLFDRAGGLWHTGPEGIRYAAPAGTQRSARMNAAQGLSGPGSAALFQDREDNVWVGTAHGIDRFSPYRLRTLALPPYMAGARPLAARPAGGVWVDRSVVSDPDALPQQFAPAGTSGDMTTALHAGPDGTLWSGGVGSLWRVRDGKREAVPLPPGLPEPKEAAIFSIASGADGALWVSAGLRGVYTLRGTTWLRGDDIPDLAWFPTTAMAADARGAMWLGSTRDRLAAVKGGTARKFGREQGLNIGTVLALLPAPGGLWVGGESGVAWFDGKRFTPITGRGGDTFSGVSGLVSGADGSLWLNGAAGLSSIAPAELRLARDRPPYRVKFKRLDYRDGLPGAVGGLTPLPSAARSSDGKLWFSTMAGTVGFDPATLPRNPHAPPVEITALKADGKEYPLQDGIRLAPGTEALEIDFTALSFRAPERVRFRYRLEGVDRDWQEPEGRRTAFYTRLAPGTYRFRVIAANDDGVWNEEGATLTFALAPTLTQATWFRVVCALAVLALLWGLHRMRLLRLARRMAAHMHERLDERERIARELHDTVLQSVQGLVLTMGAAVHGLQKSDREPLENALAKAHLVLVEGRDRVAGLRGERLAPGGLSGALSLYGESLAESGEARFELVTQGDEPPLDEGLADEVMAIAREALWNAFVHARPSSVVATLCYTQGALSLTVDDDGCGIPAEVLRKGGRVGHWGIAGMHERAANIGTLEVVSHEGEGTSWRLHVPLAKAQGSRALHAAAL